MSYIKAIIDYEAQNSPKDRKSRQRTHQENETFETTEEALEWVQERVGVENLGESGDSIYRDTENGHEQVGKIYSYWREYRDRERGIYNVWETAWVEIREVEEEPLSIERLA